MTAKASILPWGVLYKLVNTDSGLLNGSLFLRDDLRVSASLIGFNDTGLQPYDATTGAPGVGGSVIRTVRDRTVSTTVNYEPGGAGSTCAARSATGGRICTTRTSPG